MLTIELVSDGPESGSVHLLLAHGAGAPMNSPFMSLAAQLVASEGLRVSRFDFGYMVNRGVTGKRTPPPKAERLIQEYIAAVERVRGEMAEGQQLVIGGKSMGGRVASMAAQRLYELGEISGLVCLGYPFHPPGKPEQHRTAHLAALSCPTLIVQGERDPFGSRIEVEALRTRKLLSPSIDIWWAIDGDHDLGPRGNSGHTRKSNVTAAMKTVAQFCRGLPARVSTNPAWN